MKHVDQLGLGYPFLNHLSAVQVVVIGFLRGGEDYYFMAVDNDTARSWQAPELSSPSNCESVRGPVTRSVSHVTAAMNPRTFQALESATRQKASSSVILRTRHSSSLHYGYVLSS